MTFAFHGATHQLHLSFGLFDNFVSMGAIYMTSFFMLSGVVLYYVHGQCDTLNLYSLKRFYWKRFAAAFFLAQFFVWQLADAFFKWSGIAQNFLQILVSFLFCLIISILLHELVEVPAKHFLLRYR